MLTLPSVYVKENALLIRQNPNFFQLTQREHTYATQFIDTYSPPLKKLTCKKINYNCNTIWINKALQPEIKKANEKVQIGINSSYLTRHFLKLKNYLTIL